MSADPTPQGVAAQPATVDRTRFLGGSDIAAIVGLGATYDGVQQTPLTVWQRKTGEAPELADLEREKFLRRRKRWEVPIVEMLREEFEAEIVAVNARHMDPEHEFFACEIDFEWRDPSTQTIENGEIKTVSPFAFGERHGWGEEGSSDIPVHYAAQVMWGLGVTGRARCVVAAMVGLDSMIFYRLERDEETIAAMRAEALRFWRSHVVPRLPPAPQTLADVKTLMLRTRARPVELDEPSLQKFKRLQEVREQLRALGEEEEMLGIELGEFILQRWGVTDPGQQEAAEDARLLYLGEPIATWGKQRRAYLDQKRLKLEHPEIVKAFTRETVYRVLRAIKPKS